MCSGYGEKENRRRGMEYLMCSIYAEKKKMGRVKKDVMCCG